MACESSWARDGTHIIAVTRAAAVTMPAAPQENAKVDSIETGFFFFFLGPHLWYMKVPRLRVELELQLLAYARAI